MDARAGDRGRVDDLAATHLGSVSASAPVIDNRARASIVVTVGATGAGKSSGIEFALREAPPHRLMVFDPGEDYTHLGTVFRDPRKLCAHLIKAGQGACHAVFVPSLDQDRERVQFDWFCRIAFLAGHVMVVADELEDVMLPTWAPAGWRLLVRKGRKRGVRIIASSQRPAGLEKRVWSFATIVRSGVLENEEDAAVVAGRLRVHQHDIMALPELHWVQWTRAGRLITRGHVQWHMGTPRDVVDSEEKFTPPGMPPGGPYGTPPIG